MPKESFLSLNIFRLLMTEITSDTSGAMPMQPSTAEKVKSACDKFQIPQQVNSNGSK
jgi:hypothetical protein